MTERRASDAVAPMTARSWDRHERVSLAVLLGLWTLVYGFRGLAGHLSLRTNAYDLSVFDYALWNTLHGRLGYVPFYGYSIFSDHFMPILIAIAPVYALHPSAALLVVLQTLAVTGAGALFYLIVRRGLPAVAALALLLVMLVCRWSHGAEVSYFYPECFQPLFIFAMVWAWREARWTLFWIALVLLLMTKEDAALYVGAFAIVCAVTSRASRTRAVAAAVVAGTWLVVAVFVAVPMSRRADGLPAAYPFWETRLAVSNGVVPSGLLLRRLASRHSVTEIGNLLITTGGLPVVAPVWLIVPVAGVAIDLVTEPGSMQASLASHYAWPILPWVLLSAAAGLARVMAWRPGVGWAWVALLVAGTLVDAPIVRHAFDIGLDPRARAVRAALPGTENTHALVLPNLAPHVHHTNALDVLFDTRDPRPDPDLVLLTDVGDLWPFTPGQVADLVARYQHDPAYVQRAGAPLFVFARRTAP